MAFDVAVDEARLVSTPSPAVSSRRLRRLATSVAGSALFLGIAPPAAGQDMDMVEIDETLEEVLRSSEADDGSPADISITNNGEVTVDEGPAVVIDSDNTLSNAGAITSQGEEDAIGVQVLTGDGRNSNIVNSGQISVQPDVADDEIPMTGPNFGIRLEGEGAFQGDILNGGTGQIAVAGTGSVGLDLGSPIVGNVNNAGTIQLDGADSIGIRLDGALDGDLINSGMIEATNRGGETGILVSESVSGRLRNTGTVTVGSTTFINQDQEIVDGVGGPALRVNADIAGGILNGPMDPDGSAGATAALTANNAPASVLITAEQPSGGARDVTLGAVGTGSEGFAVLNRAAIEAQSDAQGAAATGLQIEGAEIDGEVFTTSLEGGIRNDDGGLIQATASDALATGIRVGDFADVPEIVNAGRITAQSRVFQADTNFDNEADIVGEGADAAAIIVEEQAAVDRIVNSGTIEVSAAGEESSALGIVDRSGTVTRLDNSGSIALQIDSDSSGRRIAIDLSNATDGVTVTNSGEIGGDVLLGAGDDTVAMTGGTLVGDLAFGGGVNSFALTDQSQFRGTLSGEVIDLSVSNSVFNVDTGDPTGLRNASFTNGSSLRLDVGADPLAGGGLAASGNLSLSETTVIETDFSVFPEVDAPIALASASELEIEGGVEQLGLQVGLSSLIFESALRVDGGERETLQLELSQRPAEEIGLEGNNARVFESAIDGFIEDPELGAAIANTEDLATLNTALDQLRPQFSEVPRAVAVNSVNLALGGVRRRMETRRDMAERAREDELFEGSPVAEQFRITPDQWSFFLKEIGTVAERDTTADARGFDGHTFGAMAGLDRAMLGLDMLGVSAMVTLSDFNDDGFNDQEFEILTGQLNLYGSVNFGGLFADFLGNFAVHDIEREHTIAFADFSRRVSADWTATQFGGSANLGYEAELGPVHARLAGSLNYVNLDEDGYREDVGETATGFIVEERDSSSLRAGGTLELDARFSIGEETQLRPRLTGGYLTELEDDFVTTRARFGEQSDPFSLSSPISQDESVIGGLSVSVITRNIIVSFGYDGEFADEFTGHTGTLSARLTF